MGRANRRLSCATRSSTARSQLRSGTRGLRRLTVGLLVLLLWTLAAATGSGVATAQPGPPPANPDNGAPSAGDQPPPPRSVLRNQQYHLAVMAPQGAQTPILMPDIARITSITEKHLDPRAPQLVATFDDQQGLRLSVPTNTAPRVYQLRILGRGCFGTQCDLTFDTKITATVTAPVVAAPGVATFTQPSADRIASAAPLVAGGAVLQDELVLTLGTPDAPGGLAQAKALAASVGASVTGGIEALGVFELRWPRSVDLTAIRATLQSQPGVTSVADSTVGLMHTQALPPGDWSDDGPAGTWQFAQMRAQQAWDITTGGSSVSVGIVDAGAVYQDHEDLDVETVLAGNPAEHATHVAGLACAEANGLGVIGVAWGCPVVSSSAGQTDKEVLSALYAVAREGVGVVNASLGYGSSGCLSAADGAKLTAEAQRNSPPFWQLFNGPLGRNIVWTFSAGNNCSVGPQSPMGGAWSLPNVITVAATNANGQLASYSNFGEGVEVAAPGGVGEGIAGGGDGVWSTSVVSCGLFGLFRCSGYEQMTGTSMAAPEVAGVAVLARSVDLDRRAADVASCIVNTAGTTVGTATARSNQPQSLTPQVPFTGRIPIVNAEAAVRCVQGGAPGGDVLIAGAGDRTGSGNGTDIGDLTGDLVRAGYSATTSASLPTDLSPYGQIWYIDTNPLSATEQDRLAAYVEAGGSVYLTGEWGCCQVDQSTIALLNRLTTNTPTDIGHGGYVDGGGLTVNPAAPGGLATTPFRLSTVSFSAAGTLTGVPAVNVVAYSGTDTSRPSVAAWDSPDVRGGGKLIVVMDINWFAEQYRGANWHELAENVAAFLAD